MIRLLAGLWQWIGKVRKRGFKGGNGIEGGQTCTVGKKEWTDGKVYIWYSGCLFRSCGSGY